MNSLEKHIFESWSDEIKVMNDLQESGVISDNAINAKDVCQEDAKKAVEWIKKNEHLDKSI